MDRLLTSREVAILLGVSIPFINALAARGALPAINVGQGSERARWRFRQSAIEVWLRNRETRPRRRSPLGVINSPPSTRT